MTTSQYLAFGTGVGANTLAAGPYAATATLIASGYTAGEADAQHVNTVLRQATVGVAGVAKFATDYGVLDCLDDGSPTNFAAAVKSALDALIASAVPTGALMTFAMTTPPAGWLECNGASLSKTTYAALYAAIGDAYYDATFMGPPAPGNFYLPDARGRVLRGWDHGAGRDPARVFGSAQDDALQNITGSFGASSSDVTALADGTGAFAHNGPTSAQWGADAKAPEAGFTFDASRVVKTDPNETRMKNVSVMVCIKI